MANAKTAKKRAKKEAQKRAQMEASIPTVRTMDKPELFAVSVVESAENPLRSPTGTDGGDQ